MTTPTLEQFVAFSADVTGFTRFELQGTGQAQAYLDTVEKVLGTVLPPPQKPPPPEIPPSEILDRILKLHADVTTKAAGNKEKLEKLLRERIFDKKELGPVVRNIVKMWFVGIWYELPKKWKKPYGIWPCDGTRVVSGPAYTEGLLWRAVGAHPSGAKAPGYGSWASPPRIPPIPLMDTLPAGGQP
jgi:hypothetical protein